MAYKKFPTRYLYIEWKHSIAYVAIWSDILFYWIKLENFFCVLSFLCLYLWR